MKIIITVSDENLDYMRKAECPTFEMAMEHLGALERNYDARVAMETVEPETI